MKRTLLTGLVLMALGCTLLGTSGCTAVQPWERAALADAKMNPARDPLMTTMLEHNYTSREASSGGRGVGGSGCGCN